MSLCLDKSVELKLRAIDGNNICVDCDSRHPQWASVSFGIFMCLDCSGKHRALGVHISFVRSGKPVDLDLWTDRQFIISMDSWNEKQIESMFNGGNKKLNDFLSSYGIAKNTSIPIKYNSPASKLYKERLLATIEGRPLPTELPKVESNSNINSISQSTEALPGESENDYVLRQKKLQEEAKERLRLKFGSSSGLSSSGKMQGIGSDSNYNPNSNSTTNLAEVSQKAISVLSSSIAILGEQVNKAKATYIDPLARPVDRSMDGSVDNPIDGSDNRKSGGWSSISNTAVNLWQTASTATLDTVSKLSKSVLVEDENDDDLRFPRTAGSLGSSKKMQGLSSDQIASSIDKSPDNDINDLLSKSVNKVTDISSPTPVIKRNLSSGLSNYPLNNQINNSTLSSTTITPSKKQQVVANAPTGDDFFANFGV